MTEKGIYVKNKLIKLLKKMHSFWWQKKRTILWRFQAHFLQIKNKKNVAQMREINNLDKILIIAPHPDDELIGCYEVLKKYGHKATVFYAGYTGNDLTEQNKKIRTGEFFALCRYMGVEAIVAQSGSINEVKEIIKTGYKAVFIPSYIDWHWEHRLVCLSALEECEKNNNTDVYLYQISVPIPISISNAYLPNTGGKWNLFDKIYVSQNYMPIQRFILMEKTRKYCGQLIEPYYRIESQQLCNAIKYFRAIKPEKLNELIHSIDNLVKIENKSAQFYYLLIKEMRGQCFYE